MELEESTFLMQTMLQSYSHQYSMVLAGKQKNRLMEQDESLEIHPHTCGHLIFDKDARIYNGERQSLQ